MSSYVFETIDHPKNKFSWNFPLAKIHMTSPPKTPLGDDWTPTYCTLPEKHLNFIDEIKMFDVRPDDVWMIAFPKCGITIAQELVWLITHNMDYDTANAVKTKVRCPFFELSSLTRETLEHKEIKAMIDIIDERASPRIIKSHLPLAFLPEELWTKDPKIIYIVRDPKDVAVSYYHQYKQLHGFQGNLEDFCELFLEGLVAYTPFDSHVNEFYRMRDRKNILFLTYEEMKADLRAIIRKAAKFFDKELSMEDIELLYDHLQPERMRKNSACNQDDLVNRASPRWSTNLPDYEIIRKAQVGTFRDEMPVEYVVKFCQYIEGKFDHGNEMFKPCTEEDECCKKEDVIPEEPEPQDETKCCSKENKKCCRREGKGCCAKEGYKCCENKNCCAKKKCCDD